jgi:hypothetical protein
MDDKFRDILLLTWNLVKRQHELLGVIIPASHEVARCLMDDVHPTLEQVQSWEAQQKKVTQELLELTAAFALVQQAVSPFQLDS